MPRSAAGTRYSLWLMPRGELWERLAQILHRLSVRYDAPEFPPHVTLLGNCVGSRRELIRQSARLAGSIRPFVIRLEAIDFLDEYFRCLFVRAALTNSLRQAHRAACVAFGRRREPPFMPHLSRLYGDFSRTLKQNLIADLGPRMEAQFKLRALHLYRTHGEPRRWRQVASFELK
jgi:2'-5' RNA ligase